MMISITKILCNTSLNIIAETTANPSTSVSSCFFGKNFFEAINSISDGIGNIEFLLVVIAIVIIVIRWLMRYNAKINEISKSKIEELKNNRKYIPGLFVELNESKENLRYFLHRKRWKHRIINEYNAIFNDHYGDLLKEAFSDRIKFEINCFTKIDTLINVMENTNSFIDALFGRKVDLPDQYKESLVVFHVFSNKYKPIINELINKAKLIRSKYYIITGSAGNGKTNLLCSFTETVISSKNRCVFLNGKDIPSDIETYYLRQLGIPDRFIDDKKYINLFRRLAEIRSFLSHRSTYIVLDAVNENTDKEFFEKLPSFINTLLKQRKTYIVLSCRSEYYEIKYKSVLTEKMREIPVVDDIVQEKYSAAALERLFTIYAKEFDYQVGINYFVKERLSKQLLLTRIFFETYGGTDTYISDLNVYMLYKQYISHISSDKKAEVEKMLSEISEIMLEKKDYSSVAVSEISENSKDIFVKIDGSVLVSKTIVVRPGSITSQEEEIIYFIFDEMRDYCITRYKMQRLCNGNELPNENDLYDFILLLKEEQASCLEGVINYSYREGQMNSWNGLCSKILNFEIKSSEMSRTNLYKNHYDLCWGLRLIFDNPKPFLNCEKEYILEIMNSCDDGLTAPLLNYLVTQEIHCGKYNLDIYLDNLKKVKKIDHTLKASFVNWLPNLLKINNLLEIDKLLQNNQNITSLNRFRKLEVLCMLYLSWSTRNELEKYLKQEIHDFDYFVETVFNEYASGGNYDHNN